MSLIVLFTVLALVLIFAPDVLLVIFAGLLFGVFFGGGGEWLARRIGIGRGWGIGLFILLIIAALAAAFLAFAPAAAEQFDRLVQVVLSAFDSLRTRLQEYAWAKSCLIASRRER